MNVTKIIAISVIMVLASCSGVTQFHNPATNELTQGSGTTIPFSEGAKTTTSKNIVILFDGTGNDFNAVSNVGRLYQLTINQNREDLAVFYTSGVGADRTGPVGLATGLGFREDVQAAYRFLAENYAGPQDKIHLYGYSRGAFSARALAGFVHATGLIELDGKTIAARDEIIHDLFTHYKFARRIRGKPGCDIAWGTHRQSIDQRRCAIKRALGEHGIPHAKHSYDDVRFSMVGLWDTVETLGLPGRTDDPTNRNPNYSDQICNMDKVAHAVSLHDNRAGAYSPKLMTRRKLVADCDNPHKALFNKVEEVWFAADHSQIGGTEALGYASGVSMNWMLDQARHIGVGGRPIFPQKAAVYEDRSDFVKDAQGQSLLFRAFPRRFRAIRCYYQPGTDPGWQEGSAVDQVKLHRSVEARLVPGTVTRLNRQDRIDGAERKGLTPPVQNAQVTGIYAPADSASDCAPVDVRWVGQARQP